MKIKYGGKMGEELSSHPISCFFPYKSHGCGLNDGLTNVIQTLKALNDEQEASLPP